MPNQDSFNLQDLTGSNTQGLNCVMAGQQREIRFNGQDFQDVDCGL